MVPWFRGEPLHLLAAEGAAVEFEQRRAVGKLVSQPDLKLFGFSDLFQPTPVGLPLDVRKTLPNGGQVQYFRCVRLLLRFVIHKPT